MSKILLFFGILLIAIVTGCSSNQDESINEGLTQSNVEEEAREVLAEKSQSELEEVDLIKGIETVILTVEGLKKALEKSPTPESVNKFGKAIEEKWDSIEKVVEKKYPEDYKDIEESLYPLIAIAKKEKPDVEKMKQLVDEVHMKLTKFKEKISS